MNFPVYKLCKKNNGDDGVAGGDEEKKKRDGKFIDFPLQPIECRFDMTPSTKLLTTNNTTD